MKRCSIDTDSIISVCPVLPHELWNDIISYPTIECLTVSAVFLLNKSLNAFLAKNSQQVLKRVLIVKLNAMLKDDSHWFVCSEEGCQKICLGMPIYHTPYYSYGQKRYCKECVRKCVGCKQYYTRSEREPHKSCAGYPEPFGSHESDHEEEYHATEHYIIQEIEEEEDASLDEWTVYLDNDTFANDA